MFEQIINLTNAIIIWHCIPSIIIIGMNEYQAHLEFQKEKLLPKADIDLYTCNKELVATPNHWKGILIDDKFIDFISLQDISLCDVVQCPLRHSRTTDMKLYKIYNLHSIDI